MKKSFHIGFGQTKTYQIEKTGRGQNNLVSKQFLSKRIHFNKILTPNRCKRGILSRNSWDFGEELSELVIATYLRIVHPTVMQRSPNSRKGRSCSCPATGYEKNIHTL